MTGALDAVVAQLERLPPDEQDRVAAWLQDELQDEARWSTSLASSQRELGLLAEEALQSLKADEAPEMNLDSL